MIHHYIKLAFRNLVKNKTNSLINIFGLATGMAAVILIFLYLQHELSYDQHHQKKDRIYRMLSSYGSKLEVYPLCGRLDDENFKPLLPEVEEVTQMFRIGTPDIECNGKHYREFRTMYADTNIHHVFSMGIIRGDKNKLFKDTYSAVITRNTAHKLFGKTNPLGQTIKLKRRNFTISAVVKDVPSTSHLEYQVLIPFQSYSDYANVKQYGLEFFTYVLFKKDVDLPAAAEKARALYNKGLNEAFSKYNEPSHAGIQKLTDIHLRSDYSNYMKPTGNIKTVYIQVFLAILILIIAIINFINIMTAQFESRAREIGMQKAMGASRGELIRQFLGQSILLSFFALVLGIILTEIMLPHFSHLLNRPLVLDYSNNIALVTGLPLLALAVGLLAGLYPAFFLTRHQPADVIKGTHAGSGKSNALTRVLVIFQFSVAMILIANVVILHQQIRFMKDADLNFNPNNVIAFENINGKIVRSYKSIKQELLKNPHITHVSCCDHKPGGGVSGQGFYMVGQEEKESISLDEYRVEPDYFEALGIKFLEGRSYESGNKSDLKGIILNEAAAHLLGTKDLIGKEAWFHNKKYHIQGIVRNFNYSTLKEQIPPLMFSRARQASYILVRCDSPQYKKIIDCVNNTFKKADDTYILGYTMIEDLCRNRYKSEENAQQLNTYASVLSIILALLGLYALTLFMMARRTKEIGIRKVNGASILQINGILLSSFTHWLLISFVIATPISWWIMNRWLENFAYRITIGPWPFVIAGTTTMLFALITVGWHTWKAANKNPVEVLRRE